MRVGSALWMVVLAGCGRLGFEATFDAAPGDGATLDTPPRQATELVTFADRPMYLAMDATTVYWTSENGTVSSCPRAGCVTPTELASEQTGAHGIDVDDTKIYWTLYNGAFASPIRSCNKTSCTPQDLETDDVGPFELHVFGENIYWTDYNGGELHRRGKSPAATNVTLATGVDDAWSLTFDTDTVYFTTNTGTGTVRSCPTVAACPVGGNLVTDSQVNPNGIIFKNGKLYWVNIANGELHRCDATACVDDDVMAITTGPTMLAADDTTLYWTDYIAEAVYACPLAGCPVDGPTVIATDQPEAGPIIVDDTHVFWGRDGAVMVLVK